MVCIHQIDNIGLPPRESQTIPAGLAEEIAALIAENTVFENRNSTYSKEEMTILTGNKTGATLQERLKGGFLVYLRDRTGALAGCGMAVWTGDRYEAKTLHISSRFRGRGYAALICDIRESVLSEHGVEWLVIESLKFPNTLGFHRSRGFVPFDDGRQRFRSVLMRKRLY